MYAIKSAIRVGGGGGGGGGEEGNDNKSLNVFNFTLGSCPICLTLNPPLSMMLKLLITSHTSFSCKYTKAKAIFLLLNEGMDS